MKKKQIFKFFQSFKIRRSEKKEMVDREKMIQKLVDVGYDQDDLLRMPFPQIKKLLDSTNPAVSKDVEPETRQTFLEREFPKLQEAQQANLRVLEQFGHELDPDDRQMILDEIEATRLKERLAEEELLERRRSLYNNIYPLLSDASGKVKEHFQRKLGL